MMIKKYSMQHVMLALEENMVRKFSFLPKLVNTMETIEHDLIIINSHLKADMFNIICRAKTADSAIL